MESFGEKTKRRSDGSLDCSRLTAPKEAGTFLSTRTSKIIKGSRKGQSYLRPMFAGKWQVGKLSLYQIPVTFSMGINSFKS